MTFNLLMNTDRPPASMLAHIAERAERIGFDGIFVPELFGREAFVSASILLGATDTITVGTAIVNVYARDPLATRASAETLADVYGNRVVLGIGVSNDLGNRQRGHAWEPPVDKLTTFITAMRDAPLSIERQGPPIPIIVAGHGPMAVARDHADGAFCYLQTAEFVAEARHILGAGPRLYSVQMVMVDDDALRARNRARKAVATYMRLPNYHRAWRRQGFDTADWEAGGSDALLDKIVATGPIDKVRAHLEAHLAAGADEIIVIPLNTDRTGEPDWGVQRELIANRNN